MTTDPNPSTLPPTRPPPLPPVVGPALAVDPRPAWREDYKPLGRPLTVWNIAEGSLKYPSRVLHELHHGRTRPVIAAHFWIALLCLAAYGLTVGSFSLGAQLWLAPAKVALGVLFSALICLPSLFVFSCLAGADSEPAKILGALAGTITVTSLLLLAFGPVSWIFAQSTQSIIFMGVLHLVFWGIALAYGLQYLRRAMVLLNGRGGAHLGVWIIIFILVTLQMSTTLRPIIGAGGRPLQSEKKFFLTHWGEQIDQAARAPRKR